MRLTKSPRREPIRWAPTPSLPLNGNSGHENILQFHAAAVPFIFGSTESRPTEFYAPLPTRRVPGRGKCEAAPNLFSRFRLVFFPVFTLPALLIRIR